MHLLSPLAYPHLTFLEVIYASFLCDKTKTKLFCSARRIGGTDDFI